MGQPVEATVHQSVQLNLLQAVSFSEERLRGAVGMLRPDAVQGLNQAAVHQLLAGSGLQRLHVKQVTVQAGGQTGLADHLILIVGNQVQFQLQAVARQRVVERLHQLRIAVHPLFEGHLLIAGRDRAGGSHDAQRLELGALRGRAHAAQRHQADQHERHESGQILHCSFLLLFCSLKPRSAAPTNRLAPESCVIVTPSASRA